jgi:hypothetical protein
MSALEADDKSSNLLSLTIHIYVVNYGDIAHLGERLLCKQ